MLVRLSPLLAALALATTACSSLTRPDEVTIVAEAPPAPAPTLRQLPSPSPAPAPAHPGGAVQRVQPQQPARQPAGTACGE